MKHKEAEWEEWDSGGEEKKKMKVECYAFERIERVEGEEEGGDKTRKFQRNIEQAVTTTFFTVRYFEKKNNFKIVQYPSLSFYLLHPSSHSTTITSIDGNNSSNNNNNNV